jgi:hypothetical protein
MTNPYDDLNEVIPCRLWRVSESEPIFEAEARILIPDLAHVSSTSFGVEPTMRKLEAAVRSLGFTGEIEWEGD